MQAVSILFRLDGKFREIYETLDPTANGLHVTLALDLENSAVLSTTSRLLDKASGPNSESSSVAFSFDFPAVLGHELDGLRDFQAEGNADGLPLKLSYPEVIAACLRGYIKIAMWIMVIPSQDLFAFYAQLDTVVHIAARSPVAPMSADQDQEVQWPPALNSPTEINVESPYEIC